MKDIHLDWVRCWKSLQATEVNNLSARFGYVFAFLNPSGQKMRLVYKSGPGRRIIFDSCWCSRVNLLQINPAQTGICKCQRGLTVDNGRVDNDAGQVRVRHGFVQDEAADAGKINIWEASAVKASDNEVDKKKKKDEEHN